MIIAIWINVILFSTEKIADNGLDWRWYSEMAAGESNNKIYKKNDVIISKSFTTWHTRLWSNALLT